MKLPTGHDKKDSLFYVEPELREHYEQVGEIRGRDRRETIERIAKYRTREKLPAQYTPGEFFAIFDELLDSDEFAQEALHLASLANARTRRDKLEKIARTREALRLASVCPCCGVVTVDEPDNERDRRSLALKPVVGLVRETDFDSCRKCFLVALEQYTREAAAEKIGKTTRADLVRKALA